MYKSYEQFKPTKQQVLFPVMIFVIAVLVGGACLFLAKSLGGDTKRIIFTIPATKGVQLEEVGSYTVYLATDTTFEGEKYTLPEGFDGLEMKVTYHDKEIECTKPQSIYQYGEEGDQYIDAYTFLAEEAGEYVLDCGLKEDTIEKAVLSVGKTQEHVGVILALTMIGCIIIIMGACQLVGYILYNGVNYGVYYFKKTRSM